MARYGHRIGNDLDLPVVLWNEHGSTQEAAALLQQAGRRGSSPGLDAEAAAVILQDYLDTRRSADDAGPNTD
ncbi:MAG: Holliday junction resolvase RuvX [Caldilineales bacterium]